MDDRKKKIGEILIEAGLINEFQLSSAIGIQRQYQGKLASILINMGFVDEKAVASAIEKQLRQKCISLDGKEIPVEVLNKVKPDIAKKYCILPIEFDQKTLTIATSDPTDLKTVDELEFMLGARIKPVLALEYSIKKAITQHYPGITFEDSNLYQNVHRIEAEKFSEIDLTKFEKISSDPEKISPDFSYSSDIVIETLIEILSEKGLTTKDELKDRVKKKLNQT